MIFGLKWDFAAVFGMEINVAFLVFRIYNVLCGASVDATAKGEEIE